MIKKMFSHISVNDMLQYIHAWLFKLECVIWIVMVFLKFD